MAKYVEKRIPIEAEPYIRGMEDGFDFYDICGTFICSITKEEMKYGYPKSNYKPYIQTSEGKLFISPTDYIITGVKGDRYPINKEIFEETYELLE